MSVRNEPKIDKLIEAGEFAERDAIHVAVVPLIAGEMLYRGCPFKLSFGTTGSAIECNLENSIGVVSPYLEDYTVVKGKRFWGLLKPGSVTGMRHQWSHPAFEESSTPKDVSTHELWLREFCDNWNFDYDQLIAAGDSAEYVVSDGRDLHSRKDLEDGEYELFWMHLEALMGKKYDNEHRETMQWSCSC